MADEEITAKIIGAAIEVHRHLGPGLLESTYEVCLCDELAQRGLRHENQKPMPVSYKGRTIDCGYRIDLLVENRVIVELKAVQEVINVHQAQILSYLKMSGLKTGLLINFNSPRLVDGVFRISN